MGTARFGIDIGGTFTDIALQIGSDRILSKKILSTPHYYGEALVEGVTALIREAGISGDDVGEIVHATTVVTNAILQRTGARVGVLTTTGFRDVLELARMRLPRLYDLMWDKPVPLVPRNLRLGVDERIDAQGNVVQPLDLESAKRAIARLVDEGVEAVAICLLNSYKNPRHEMELRDLVASQMRGVPVTISSELTPDIGEYERTSTTVVNAYSQPLVASYLDRIVDGLRSRGVNCPVRLMQSNGDSIALSGAIERPVNLVESGGAAGVIAARYVARRAGYENVLVFDMGGTSAKATLIENGELTRVTEFEIGAEISMSTRLARGSGYPLMVSAVDVAEVGAGGGSIAWIDAGGALKVGPMSAGAAPGPACYGQGGNRPTVTDANAVLGYLPDALAANTLPLDKAAARQVLATSVADPLGIHVLDAALGIRNVAISTMVRAARAVTIERGHDVRDFTMIAFGGSAPLHAMDVALALGIRRVVVPRLAGILSSVGLLAGEHGREFIQAVFEPVDELDLAAFDGLLSGLEGDAVRSLSEEGTDEDAICLSRSAIVRYAGQQSDLKIPIPPGKVTAESIESFKSEFHATHLKAFGHNLPFEPVVVMKVIVRAHAQSASTIAGIPFDDRVTTAAPMREAYFGPESGLIKVPALSRATFPQDGVFGPAVVDDEDCTTLIPSDCVARLDSQQNLILEAAVVGAK